MSVEKSTKFDFQALFLSIVLNEYKPKMTTTKSNIRLSASKNLKLEFAELTVESSSSSNFNLNKCANKKITAIQKPNEDAYKNRSAMIPPLNQTNPMAGKKVTKNTDKANPQMDFFIISLIVR